MKPLYTPTEISEVKYQNFLPLQCYRCNHVFFRTKEAILKILRPNSIAHGKFCSTKCLHLARTFVVELTCKQCNKSITKQRSNVKRTKNQFCSQSCSTKYTNSHKTTGISRSKLELWLETELLRLYPNIDFNFNTRKILDEGLELDIYIPSLNVAFEINGIHHYLPIYGNDKLIQTQNKDVKKQHYCENQNIVLYTINTSHQKIFNPNTSQQYLNEIIKILYHQPV